MRVAAIDLGSNTFLCLIADITGGRIESIIADETELVRLGQKVDKTRRFHPEALSRAKTCLTRYAHLIRQHQVERVLAVATSAARDAAGAAHTDNELVQICKELHIPVEIISGEREATLTFRGATTEMSELAGLAVIDVGGGSTEIVLLRESGELISRSLDIGSVRLTEKFVQRQPPGMDVKNLMQSFVKSELATFAIPVNEIKQVVAVAGTPTLLASLELKTSPTAKAIDGYCLSQGILNKWSETFAGTAAADIVNRYGIEEKRADVILAGTTILSCALEFLQKPVLTVSVRGVRYGLALSIASDC